MKNQEKMSWALKILKDQVKSLEKRVSNGEESPINTSNKLVAIFTQLEELERLNGVDVIEVMDLDEVMEKMEVYGGWTKVRSRNKLIKYAESYGNGIHEGRWVETSLLKSYLQHDKYQYLTWQVKIEKITKDKEA